MGEKRMENKRRTGTLCVFLAAVLYSIGGLCIKLIPWGGMAINGARTAIALVVIGAYLAVIRHPLRFNRWVAVGALSIFGTNALFSVANKLTTAANVIVLQFTAPIFVILFSALFWRRKPGRLDLLACGSCSAGCSSSSRTAWRWAAAWAMCWPCCPAWPMQVFS